ncbi:MAG: glycoside hydrolase family 16 protein [Bacteroidales bacterium]|nr:glycoside hydrolase family 16 protein [Bacteroidales bacterium]
MKLIVFLAACSAAVNAVAACPPVPEESCWIEEFDSDTVDTHIWSRVRRGGADWNRHMSDLDSLVCVEGGILNLRGIASPADSGSTNPDVLTGGLQTSARKGFGYGCLEVRARLQGAASAWPAIWMMPVDAVQWPYGGEIDIIERLNYDDFVYMTCHTAYTQIMGRDDSLKGSTAPIDRDGWNVYGLEHYRDSLIWTVNGVPAHRYLRQEGAPAEQWPFDRDYYLILSMQLGGSWVGPVCVDDLPVSLQIDWIRFTPASVFPQPAGR